MCVCVCDIGKKNSRIKVIEKIKELCEEQLTKDFARCETAGRNVEFSENSGEFLLHEVE